MQGDEKGKRVLSLGLGIERLGLLALRAPVFVSLTLALLVGILTPFYFNKNFEADTREIFRSSTADFAALNRMVERYPGTLSDLLLVVETAPDSGDGAAAGLLSAAVLEKINALVMELEFVEGVQRVHSIFHARTPPDEQNELGLPVIPEGLAGLPPEDRLRETLLHHPVIAGQMLAKDGASMMLVLTLQDMIGDLEASRRVVREVEQLATRLLADAPLRFAVGGLPMLRVEIISNLHRDQLLFTLLGLLFTTLITWLFLRRPMMVVITSAPAIAATVILIGGMTALGQKINVFTNMVTPLVLVMALVNAMHLMFAVRLHLRDGLEPLEAVRQAVLKTGQGCVLSSITTAIALLSLTLVSYPIIANFGLVAAAGVITALLCALLLVPAICLLALRANPQLLGAADDRPRYLEAWVDMLCNGFAWIVGRAPVAMMLLGLLIASALAWLYAQNAPRYVASENLPSDNAAFLAIHKIDRDFAGSGQVNLLLTLPNQALAISPENLDYIRQAHELLSGEPLVQHVFSLAGVERWLREGGIEEAGRLAFLRRYADELEGRLITTTPATAIAIGYIKDSNASELTPVLDRLRAKLARFNRQHVAGKAELTGNAALEARASFNMIDNLNTSLVLAVSLIILAMGLLLRSFAAGAASILPNLLPLVAGGAFVYLSGAGFQFTSMIAFTIGFGMAVDDTIHYFNRYRLSRLRGLAPAEALADTTRTIGPVLMISTVVLMSGIGITILSHLPMVQLFGKVSALVLATALVGDLLFLPAIIHVMTRLFKGVRI